MITDFQSVILKPYGRKNGSAALPVAVEKLKRILKELPPEVMAFTASVAC